jgi:hypothetical protein
MIYCVTENIMPRTTMDVSRNANAIFCFNVKCMKYLLSFDNITAGYHILYTKSNLLKEV